VCGPLAAFFVAHFVVNGADVELAASVPSTYNSFLTTPILSATLTVTVTFGSHHGAIAR